jgi:hypothetical protein
MQVTTHSFSPQKEEINLKNLKSDLSNLNPDTSRLIQGYITEIFQAHLVQVVQDLISKREELAKGKNPPLYKECESVRKELITYVQGRLDTLKSNGTSLTPALQEASGHIQDVLMAIQLVTSHSFDQALCFLQQDVQKLNEDLKTKYISLLSEGLTEKLVIFQEKMGQLERDLQLERELLDKSDKENRSENCKESEAEACKENVKKDPLDNCRKNILENCKGLQLLWNEYMKSLPTKQISEGNYQSKDLVKKGTNKHRSFNPFYFRKSIKAN